MSPDRRRAASLAALPIALAVAPAATVLLLAPDLPDPAATHFGPGGEADGFMALPAVLAFTTGMQVAIGGLLAALASSARHAVPGGRTVMGLPAGVVAFVGAMVVVTLLPQRGLDDATAATLAGWAVPVAVGVAVTAGLLASLLAPPAPGPGTARGPAPTGAPRTDLGGAVPFWRGWTRAGRAMPVLVGVVVVLAAVLSWVAGPLVVLPIMLLPLVALLASFRFSVTIGPAGIGVRGALGWPRTVVDIDAITHADVEQVAPMAYGGWGWRIALDGRTAVVTAAGRGLVVHRADAPALVVTVEDPERAAGVVNELVDRREDSRAAGAP